MNAASRPTVSVVVPCFNGEKYLRETLGSVVRQTYPKYEVLVVDDGSTDSSLSIAQELADADARFSVLRRPHAGVSAARNAAISVAKGEWVALLDADDVWLPEKLQRQVDFIENNSDVVALGTYGFHIGETGVRSGAFDVGPTTRQALRTIVEECEPVFLLASSVVFSRRVALECGGFVEGLAAQVEDVLLWTRMAGKGPVLALPERHVLYRVHSRSASSTQLRAQRQLTRWIRTSLRAEREGVRPPTHEEFRIAEGRNGLVRRALRFLKDSGAIHYRTAGGMIANRRYVCGFVHLMAGGLLNPGYVLAKLRRQARPLFRRGQT